MSYNRKTVCGSMRALIVATSLTLIVDASPAAGTYRPGGEYIKDHSIIRSTDGVWHLFSISGTEGTTWMDSHSEECFSHSVSLDLQNWRFVGHVLPASGQNWNASKVWAPHVIQHEGEYWMFYTGVRTEGEHIESIGIARSQDLYHWREYKGNPVWECPEWGRGHQRLRPCRDPMVLRDEKEDRWVLYYTTYYNNDSRKHAVGAAVSTDLIHWEDAGPILRRPSARPDSLTESCFVIQRNDRYWAFLNDGYAVSEDPLRGWSDVRPYVNPPGGFAGEVFKTDGSWLRSVVVPVGDHKMGLRIREIDWQEEVFVFRTFDGVRPAAPPATGFVTARGRNFWLNGSPFYPYGTNYHPQYGQPLTSTEDWFTDYRPEEIDIDLDLMQQAGLNAIRMMASHAHLFELRDKDWSRYPSPKTSYRARLHDFLDRCLARDIRAQLFVSYCPKGGKHGPTHLFRMNWDPQARQESLDSIRKLIGEGELSGHPGLLSYEIDWEPHVGHENVRNSPSGKALWNRWVRDTYGTINETVKRWQFDKCIVSDANTVSLRAPLDFEIRKDGPWTPMCIAYRRFIEDMINRRQAYIHRAIRELDSNHMICSQRVYFGDAMDRMTVLEFPTRTTLHFLDYVGLTFSPHLVWGRHSEDWYEAHGEQILQEGYGVAAATDGRPVVFAEYGKDTLWHDMDKRPEETVREASQAEQIRWMHRVALDSGAAGIFVWWWQGRRPMNERDPEVSDWGVIRPDGTPRPAFQVLRDNAPLFRERDPFFPLKPVTINPYVHAAEELRYPEGQQSYAATQSDDGIVQYQDVRWNSTSRTVIEAEPEDAVIPLIGLNSLFYEVTLNNGDRTERIWRGREVRVDRDDKLVLQPTVVNTGNALWLSERYNPDKGSTVQLKVSTNGESRSIPLTRDVPRDAFHAFAPIEIEPDDNRRRKVSLRMTTGDGREFGEKLVFSVRYATAETVR